MNVNMILCLVLMAIPIQVDMMEKEIVKEIKGIEPDIVTVTTYSPSIEQTDSTPLITCLLYTSPSPRDRQKSRMPSSA